MNNEEKILAMLESMSKEIKDLKTEVREMRDDLSGQIADSVVTLTEYFGEEINKIHKRIGEVDTIATAALKGTVLLGGTLTKQ